MSKFGFFAAVVTAAMGASAQVVPLNEELPLQSFAGRLSPVSWQKCGEFVARSSATGLIQVATEGRDRPILAAASPNRYIVAIERTKVTPTVTFVAPTKSSDVQEMYILLTGNAEQVQKMLPCFKPPDTGNGSGDGGSDGGGDPGRPET